jgi:hypothetical protein
MEKQAFDYARTFKEISKIILPSSCLNKAYKQMRLAAMQGQEAVALFAGVVENSIFHIIETIIPGQVSPPLKAQWCSLVPEQERQRILAWLQENEFELIAQIHSVPRQACLATPNQAWPLIRIMGGISIVVPDFALAPANPGTWAVYRLVSDNKWIALDKLEICHLFEITY